MRQSNRKFRSLFISDVHLGTPRVMASDLYNLLTGADYDYLYLLGDIIDVWRSRDKFYWSPEQRRLLMAIVERSRNGVDVKYVPGNHDNEVEGIIDPALDYLPSADEYLHNTADGRSFLVTHGDQFDEVGRFTPASAKAGEVWWSSVAGAEFVLNGLRRVRKLPDYNLSLRVRKVIADIINYEKAFIENAVAETRKWGYDGVICGHTHQPAMRECDGVLYANCGDWVAVGSAVVENYDGGLELIYWNKERKSFANARRKSVNA